MKGLMKIEGIGRLPFTKICPEKAADAAFLEAVRRFSGERYD
jgi:hypothetical protein